MHMAKERGGTGVGNEEGTGWVGVCVFVCEAGGGVVSIKAQRVYPCASTVWGD